MEDAGNSAAITGNNGNVLGQTVNTLTRTYSYDGASRLCRSAQGSTWTESYAYDGRGNMGVNRTGALPAGTAELIPNTGAYNLNNRVTAWSYDAAGNLAGIPSPGGSTIRAACASTVMPGAPMLGTACYDAEKPDDLGNQRERLHGGLRL